MMSNLEDTHIQKRKRDLVQDVLEQIAFETTRTARFDSADSQRDFSNVTPTPSYEKVSSANLPTWQIALYAAHTGAYMLSHEVKQDIKMGRATQDSNQPEIDLVPFGAVSKGVSREHAVIRPSEHKLYLIDLGSSNGTLVNGIQITSNQAHPLSNNDVVTLGKLSFSIKIIAQPRAGKSS